uniref:thiol oxidase n=1 Tax=viral metagenome TaxID=1070528 RepID=A0A6C0L0S3_9ZZZZ
MKKAVWGPIVWKTLHCITLKVKDEEFINEREQIIQIITSICSNLPCPQCSSHSMGIIRRYKLSLVKTKTDLIKFVYMMHNHVNKRLNKKNYTFQDIEHYNNYNIKTVLSNYYTMNINMKQGEKMMLYSYHRRQFLKLFYNYFNNNISKFNQ